MIGFAIGSAIGSGIAYPIGYPIRLWIPPVPVPVPDRWLRLSVVRGIGVVDGSVDRLAQALTREQPVENPRRTRMNDASKLRDDAERAAMDAWKTGSADSTQMLIAVRAACDVYDHAIDRLQDELAQAYADMQSLSE